MNELQQNRMALAARILKDAYSTATAGTRATAAFDAGYLYTLVALDAPSEGEHPSRAVLQEAVEEFGLAGQGIRSAFSFLDLQYSPTGPGELIPRLLVWVQEMKLLAERLWGNPR